MLISSQPYDRYDKKGQVLKVCCGKIKATSENCKTIINSYNFLLKLASGLKIKYLTSLQWLLLNLKNADCTER